MRYRKNGISFLPGQFRGNRQSRIYQQKDNLVTVLTNLFSYPIIK
jgi:hypothetical protein